MKPALGSRWKRQPPEGQRGGWSDLESLEGKPQRKRGVLVSPRDPESPGPPNTAAGERRRGPHWVLRWTGPRGAAGWLRAPPSFPGEAHPQTGQSFLGQEPALSLGLRRGLQPDTDPDYTQTLTRRLKGNEGCRQEGWACWPPPTPVAGSRTHSSRQPAHVSSSSAGVNYRPPGLQLGTRRSLPRLMGEGWSLSPIVTARGPHSRELPIPRPGHKSSPSASWAPGST